MLFWSAIHVHAVIQHWLYMSVTGIHAHFQLDSQTDSQSVPVNSRVYQLVEKGTAL